MAGSVASSEITTLEVDRDDLAISRLWIEPARPLERGQVRLAVEGLALTGNTVTYARLGDELGYWRLFPATDGFGRVPTWGHATVVETAHDDVATGTRLYGLVPISDGVVLTPERVGDGWLRDAAVTREGLNPAYGHYDVVRGATTIADRDRRAVLAPVFLLSFVLDDWLAEHDWFGADAILLTSASSKAALGTAHLMADRDVAVVGATSPHRVGDVTALDVHDLVVGYDTLASIPRGPTVLVDLAGNTDLRRAVRDRLGDGLRREVLAGRTHPGQDDAGTALFFAPDRIVARTREWGREDFAARFDHAFAGFAAWTASWFRIDHATGPDAVEAAYHDVRQGRVDTEVGVVGLVGGIDA